jgi:hypothetical protein
MCFWEISIALLNFELYQKQNRLSVDSQAPDNLSKDD